MYLKKEKKKKVLDNQLQLVNTELVDPKWMKLCGTCLLWILGIPKLAKQVGAELGQAQLKLELRMLTGAKKIYSLLKVDWRWSKTAKNRSYLVLVVGKGKNRGTNI